jgi:hypothetical protein
MRNPVLSLAAANECEANRHGNFDGGEAIQCSVISGMVR